MTFDSGNAPSRMVDLQVYLKTAPAQDIDILMTTVIRRLVKRGIEAEDAADAFQTLCKTILISTKTVKEAALTAYFVTAAYHIHLYAYRSGLKTIYDSAVSDLPDPRIERDRQSLEDRDRLETIDTEIRKLVPEQQRCVWLHFQGLNLIEISKEINMTRHTAGRYLVKALRILKKRCNP